MPSEKLIPVSAAHKQYLDHVGEKMGTLEDITKRLIEIIEVYLISLTSLVMNLRFYLSSNSGEAGSAHSNTVSSC